MRMRYYANLCVAAHLVLIESKLLWYNWKIKMCGGKCLILQSLGFKNTLKT